ncbi:MAG TPA: acetate--CoA ligase [Deltaproteobacteria bacterium]|jgi:acetyl-CoA synthetase|nr:acetate--CoA ligase [Deltaproteobacteria bacterium]
MPNLLDYEAARKAFSWDIAARELDGLPGGRGLNIAHEAVDRHVAAGRGERTALRWLGRGGEVRLLSYSDLAAASSRFANVLGSLGVLPGERVFTLCGRLPELYITALGSWKAGAVFSPLFSAFGPEPIRERIEKGDGRVVVTTSSLYERRLAGLRSELPCLRHVLLVREPGPETHGPLPSATQAFADLLAKAPERFAIPPTAPDSPAILHFTSGTTGTPKGALHLQRAVIAHHYTGKIALDLHLDDVFWCTADPGWVTGTSYGIVAPLTHGITSIVDEADFDAERWYRTLEEQRVTVWYTAPTAVRMLMRAGSQLARRFDLSALRFIASVGEPLNPECVVWGQETLGLPIHDNWWQTETGGIMIANYAALEIRPGSMGLPLPGVDALLVRRERDGKVTIVDDAGVQGEIALRPGWPSLFHSYVGEEERTRKCFAGGLYLSGDLATRDHDGYFWFVGRADDVIKSSGHLIGPFEVESVLLEHPAVADAGVIGKPDPVAGEVVKAFVSLKPGVDATPELARELQGFGRKRLGAAVAPKEISFVSNIPKTRSGKIMRRLLKARELGLPEGDISTLETEP